MKGLTLFRNKRTFFLFSAFFCLTSVLNIFIYEFYDSFSNEIAETILVCVACIWPFQIFAVSIAIGISNVLSFKVHPMVYRIIIVLIIWIVVTISTYYNKRFVRTKEIIIKTLLWIDILFHGIFMIGGLMHLPSLWGITVLGATAVIIDILILKSSLKALKTIAPEFDTKSKEQGDGSKPLKK